MQHREALDSRRRSKSCANAQGLELVDEGRDVLMNVGVAEKLQGAGPAGIAEFTVVVAPRTRAHAEALQLQPSPLLPGQAPDHPLGPEGRMGRRGADADHRREGHSLLPLDRLHAADGLFDNKEHGGRQLR